jgi:hypothetical protein
MSQSFAMPDLLSQQKSQLCSHCRALRKSLGDERRAQASLSICKRIENWRVFQQSEVIFTYMPIKSEVDLTPLLERQPHKRWILPRIIPKEGHRMVFHPYIAGLFMDEFIPSLWHYSIPVFGTILSMRDLLSGHLYAGSLVVMFVSSLVYAALILALAVWLFQREEVVFRT